MTGPAAVPQAEVISILTAEILTTRQVSDLLRVSKHDLATWRMQRHGPPFLMLRGARIGYSRERFQEWLKRRGYREMAR